MGSFQEFWVRWTPNFLVKWFASPYVAGDSLQKAFHVVDSKWSFQGIYSTLDLLGEGIQSKEDVEKEVAEYLRMLQQMGERKNCSLSLKPSQMGIDIDVDYCRQNIEKIVEEAKKKNVQITIDMEESKNVDATLSLFQNLRKKHDNLGTVLQARLFRTSDDIERYLSGFQARIRLCLGIYKEKQDISFQDKKEIKENYFLLFQKLLDAGHWVEIATHDLLLLEKCLEETRKRNLSAKDFEVQMLLGVPREQAIAKLREEGIQVRLYVPYATDWNYAFAYLKRRMLENPQMVFYVLSNLLQRLKKRLKGK